MLTLNQVKIVSTPGSLDLYITREFDAPRELVFKALTDPNYFNKWIGTPDYTITLDKYDLKKGGLWRYIYDNNKGTKYAFNGVFHDIVVPERVTSTSEIEGLPEGGHVWLKTAKFESLQGGRTKVSSQVVFLTVEDRDRILQSGWEKMLNESYERLDSYLAKELHK